ncbi:MAG: DUF2184 domain-containing protein [Acidobacteria bacterium]|nr:DUF2184 domain-containing protein [Acidobacteriota bacterium]
MTFNQVNLYDAQANLGFVLSQTSHIERQVQQVAYEGLVYSELIPVSTEAHPFAKTVTFFYSDNVGKADWVNGNSNDIPVVGMNMSKEEEPIFTAAIGYNLGFEEVGQARMLGHNLSADYAIGAARVAEEMCDRVALLGDTGKSLKGLLNNSSIDTVAFAAGAGSTTTFETMTPDEILARINQLLTGMVTGTRGIENADTLLMPLSTFTHISTRRLTDSNMTVLAFIKANNVYTALTGKPLDIRGLTDLETIASGAKRMIAYRRSPEVLKFHLPMPHQFLPPQVAGLNVVVPGVMRMGGTNIRRPKAVRYATGF